MTSRLNAPKRVTCPKGVSHRTFRRSVEVAGVGSEILDENLGVVALGSPNIQRVSRPDTTVLCATCGTIASVRIN
jgi:hypothetical protein